MLICPQCQFENPITNKFCQQCGVSLTHNTCPECNSLVPFKQIACQECGAISGVTWWAIISPVNGNLEPGKVSVPRMGDRYLDLHHRYHLIDELQPTANLDEVQGQVLDCEPFQLSPLEALVLKGLENEDLLEEDTADKDTVYAEKWAASMTALSVPDAANAYIALCNSFYHVIPTIHNAWRNDAQAILLLEDRSDYPLLLDLWTDREISPPLLQILEWLHEMSCLWSSLSEWQCQQSLMVIDNLRVDPEDQTLCLQRLYFNAPEVDFDLKELGHLWRSMFAESQATHLEAISQLLHDLENEKLTTVEEVKSRIKEIAQILQPPDVRPNTANDEDDDMQTGPLDMQGIDSQYSGPDAAIADSLLNLAPTAPPVFDEDDTRFDNDDPTIVLPMQLFNLEEAGRTDVGRQRDHNEDYFGIETQVIKLESPSGKTVRARNLYILCDGMGGHAGGEVASALAVDTIRNYFKEKWQNTPFPGAGAQALPDVAMMTEAVLQANKAIYDVNQQNARSGSGRMGTTLVLVLIHDTEVAIAHVGDSRVYRYTRKRGLEQITIDHEVGQREIQRGIAPEVAYSRPDAYQLTQALGPRDENFVKPDVQFLELNEDMLLLLCSDGLSDNDLLEKHWESHIHPMLSSQTNLDKGTAELIDLANRYNGHDNITAIAIRAKVRPSLDHLR